MPRSEPARRAARALTVDRRTFLRAAGGVAAGSAAGALAGCSAEPAQPDASRSSTPAGSSPTPSPPPTSGTTGAPAPPNWPALRDRLSGRLVLPGEPGYQSARRAYNPLFDGRRPAAVATCRRPDDVLACVEVARDAAIPIAARSGGHSYAGYSTPGGGLVVDLGGMSRVRVRQDGTAVIGAGARLIDVYARLAAAGRCLPAGSCPTVGIAGLTLGGGIGVLTRKYGLTCDRLVSARVVTADGTLRTVSAENEPDLFWALRGGGGGNLGIVTSFTFATEPAPPVTVFSLRFASGAAPDVVGAWQRWIAGAPDELWSNCVLSAGSTPSVRVGGCFVGSPAALSSLLGDLPPATSTYVEGMAYLDAMRYFAGCSSLSVSQCHLSSSGGQLGRESFVASSRVLRTPVANPDRLVGLLDGRSGMDVLLDSLGGAVSAIAPGDTAFPYRSALASAQIYAGVAPGGRRGATRQVAEVRDGLGELVGDTGYVNYIDPRMPNWAHAYYGGNLDRLREIAAAYDPDAVFSFAQSITRR